MAWDDRDRAVACNSYDRPAEFILLVEKDAAFMRLAEDRFYNRHDSSVRRATCGANLAKSAGCATATRDTRDR